MAGIHHYTIRSKEYEGIGTYMTVRCKDCHLFQAAIVHGPRGYTKGVLVEKLRKLHLPGNVLAKRPSKE